MRIRTLSLANQCHHHDHDYHQFVLPVRGSAEFEIEGRGGVVDSVHGCLVPSQDIHYYEGIGDNHHLIIDLQESHFHSRLSGLFDAPRYFPVDRELRMLIRYLRMESIRFNFFPEATHSCITTLMAAIYYRVFNDRPDATPGKLNLQLIDTFIDQYLGEKITVADLAALCHLSSGHFNSLFLENFLMTPYQFIMRKRLKRAHELIVVSKMPLYQVAEECGFSNQSALSNAFQKHYGHTPSTLRKQTR